MELELVPMDDSSSSVGNQVPAEERLVYRGPERRRNLRRITVDRREMVRFENKPERRAGRDRRIELQMWKGREM